MTTAAQTATIETKSEQKNGATGTAGGTGRGTQGGATTVSGGSAGA
ncbi:Asp23/Gls24 family envelope stress response protein, partial [Streptomyces coelicoflavus]|nr:Asp23/Gls24 family envelope stress response protein [Streptomyces coelicoflavus]